MGLWENGLNVPGQPSACTSRSDTTTEGASVGLLPITGIVELFLIRQGMFVPRCCRTIMTVLLLLSLSFFFHQAALGSEMAASQGQILQTTDKGKGVEVPIGYGEGLPVDYVYVHLFQSTGNHEQDEQLRQQLANMFGLRPGDHFRSIIADAALRHLQNLPSVKSITYRLYQSEPPGKLVVALLAEPAPKDHEAKKPDGMVISKSLRDFPKLYEDGRSLLKLILNGGVGAYSDTDPWFGKGAIFNRKNPTAKRPAGPGTNLLMEAYIEPGLGGITQLGDTPFYPYGAVTYMVTWSSGQDIYSPGSRTWGDFEKAYAGFLYAPPGNKTALNVSYGRQDYQLRDGFLISTIPGSNDLAYRGALNLGPRNVYNTAGFIRYRLYDFSLEGILLEPDELRMTRTNTRLLGANVQYNSPGGIQAAFSYLYIPRSDKAYFVPVETKNMTREGLRTFNPAITINPLFGVDGLWVKSEYAHQNNANFDMSADAYYVWVGYRAEKWPWRPGLSYRYSSFSGDDPTTQTFERFDPLFSGRSNFFLPGLISSKVILNSNLRSHRATFSVFPRETLELLIEYFHHSAERRNNLGGIGPLQTLGFKDLIQELQFNMFWFIGKNWYFQGIASAGMPGKAIDRALGGGTKNWYELQASLYMFF